MKPPPDIGGERVVTYAVVENTRATGATVHNTPHGAVPEPYGVAICKSRDGVGWYLFYCNQAWEVLADTWHASEADAKAQAQFEFEGVTALWQVSL